MFSGITSDILLHIAVNMFGCIVEVKNNGFLSSQNIDISWDKIFVDPATLKVRLVYLPVNVRVFESFSEFQSELRSSLIKLIDKILPESSERMDKFVPDLANGSMSLEEIFNKYKGAGGGGEYQSPRPNTRESDASGLLKLVAMNAPEYFEIQLDRPKVVIGKKQGMVDAVVSYNNMISRKHCTVMKENGIYQIEDEGSSNGTYVNGARLMPHRPVMIKRGDIIRMANSDFQLV